MPTIYNGSSGFSKNIEVALRQLTAGITWDGESNTTRVARNWVETLAKQAKMVHGNVTPLVTRKDIVEREIPNFVDHLGQGKTFPSPVKLGALSDAVVDANRLVAHPRHRSSPAAASIVHSLGQLTRRQQDIYGISQPAFARQLAARGMRSF
ncbi:hypothetical protein JCM10207_004756 [Rhodosporidiobolus poonsookiae]